MPAATLLLPYFEVDLNADNGTTTLFSVNNASAGTGTPPSAANAWVRWMRTEALMPGRMRLVSGAGMVTVTLNGKGEMRGVKIDPSLMKPDEAEIVEDLVVAAAADAKAKVDAASQEKMKAMTGGLPIPPGLKLW